MSERPQTTANTIADRVNESAGPPTTGWLTRLRAAFAWETVRDTGCWLYQRNRITGCRRIVRSQPGGYQPVDRSWIGRDA